VEGSVFRLQRFLSKSGPGRALEYFPRHQTLFIQGKWGNAVFYILVGVVGLTVLSRGGKRERIISLLGPGSFAGKECIAKERPRSMASARTVTDCTVLRIERKEMLRMIRDEKTFAALFLDYLLGRITQYQEVIMDHLSQSSEKRLARTLLLLTHFGDGGKAESVVPNFSQTELAEVIGTTRSRVSFFMNSFRNQGFIAYKSQGPITICTPELSRWLTNQE